MVGCDPTVGDIFFSLIRKKCNVEAIRDHFQTQCIVKRWAEPLVSSSPYLQYRLVALYSAIDCHVYWEHCTFLLHYD